jgi:hypothetical protein
MNKKTQVHDILTKYENQVWSSFPSVYTKDDIKRMMNEIIIEVDDVLEKESTDIDLDDLQQKIILSVVDTIESFDFEDEIELELNYNKQIDISFDNDSIIRNVRDSIKETFSDFTFIEEEETEEVES